MKRKTENQFFDNCGILLGYAQKFKTDIIEIRIDTPLTPQASGIKRNLVISFDVFGQQHFQLKHRLGFKGGNRWSA